MTRDTLKAIALDFDGVICDSLEESLLVTWYAHNRGTLADFGAEGLRGLSQSFVDRFVQCRCFARHLGHFYASLLDDFDGVATQAAFDAAFARIAPADVETFVERATAYRASVRDGKRSQWLERHTVYEGMMSVLKKAPRPVYIVTAKDAASVVELLAHFGLVFDSRDVFGERRDKIGAFGAIAAAHSATADQVAVVDDNVYNAIAAHRAGYTAHWALWGFRAPGHERLAEEHRLPTVTLEALTAGRLWREAAIG